MKLLSLLAGRRSLLVSLIIAPLLAGCPEPDTTSEPAPRPTSRSDQINPDLTPQFGRRIEQISPVAFRAYEFPRPYVFSLFGEGGVPKTVRISSFPDAGQCPGLTTTLVSHGDWFHASECAVWDVVVAREDPSDPPVSRAWESEGIWHIRVEWPDREVLRITVAEEEMDTSAVPDRLPDGTL